ncbi:MAG: ATP-binding protein [Ruminococcaceae bacterium]|nr:ATP-binding protein [Oscillospiraceae bacterium]
MSYIDDKVREVIDNLPNECAYIDYKEIPYLKTYYHDLVKDVIAMLNSLEAKGHDKFIVFGITDNKEKIGIESFLRDSKEKFDDAIYQNSFDKIFPRPHIQCGKIEYENHTYGYIYIEDKLNTADIYEVQIMVLTKTKF